MFLLPPGKLLEMITIDAAKALGWDDEIGSLDVGKKADVAIVNLRQPHLTPNIMVVHRLVYEAVGNDVETVIVDGKILMEERKVLTIDEGGALDLGQEESLKLIERAGCSRTSTSRAGASCGWSSTRRSSFRAEAGRERFRPLPVSPVVRAGCPRRAADCPDVGTIRGKRLKAV